MQRQLPHVWLFTLALLFTVSGFALGETDLTDHTVSTTTTTTTEATTTYYYPKYYHDGRWVTGDGRVVTCEGDRITLSTTFPSWVTPHWRGPNGLNRRARSISYSHLDLYEAGEFTATWDRGNGHVYRVKIIVDVVGEPRLSFETEGETCAGHDGAIDLTVSHLPKGVFFEMWDGVCDRLPTSWPVYQRDQSGISKTGFDISLAERHSAFSMRFTATLDVPTNGEYTFYTSSDDGSKLYIDGRLVVNNDGLHAMQERSGRIHLTKGNHQIEVTFFEKYGGEGLSVKWKGPGFAKQHIPTSRLFVPYTVHWSNGSCDEDLTGIDDGRYNVNVYYAGRNCSVSGSATVTPGNDYLEDPGTITTGNKSYCIAPDAKEFDPPAFQTTSATCWGGKTPYYQWQVKTEMGGSWRHISGANGKNYNPGPRGPSSRWYRRLAKCDCSAYFPYNASTPVRDIHVFPTPEARITKTDADCDDETGSITFSFHYEKFGQNTTLRLSIDGGNTFTNVDGTSGSFTFENVAPGTYSPVARWQWGNCAQTFPHVTVKQREAPSADFALSPNRVCDGESLTFTAAEVEAGAMYSWTFGEFATPATATGPGPHVVTFNLPEDRLRNGGSDVTLTAKSDGCSDEVKKRVHVLDLVDADVTSTDPTCDDTNGTITVSYPDHPNRVNLRIGINGADGQTVSVADNTGSFTFENLAAGSYDVVARWGNGDCGFVLLSTEVLENQAGPGVKATASASPVTTGTEVTLKAEASGGTAPYSFQWDQGAGAGAMVVVTPSTTTTYTVRVTDANGCTDEAPVTVTVLPLPTATVTSTDPTCGDANGTIKFSFDDVAGRSAISLSIDGGGSFTTVPDNSMMFTFSDLAAGDYDAAVRWSDGLGGTVALETITLEDQAAPTVSISADVMQVCAGTSAKLTAVPDGGTGNYTFSWSTGAKESMITVTPDATTTYTVEITDGNGCTATANKQITVKPNPEAEIVCEAESLIRRDATNVTNCDADGTEFGLFAPGILQNLVSTTTIGASDFFTIENGVFEEDFSTGTAVLTGRLTSRLNPSYVFDMVVNFTLFTVNPAEPALTEELCAEGVGLDVSDWSFYETTNGTLTGVDGLSGAEVRIERRGPAFQVGIGASLAELDRFSASGWVKLFVESQPDNSSVVLRNDGGADIRVNLSDDEDCFNILSGSSVDLSVNAFGGSGNYTYEWSTGETGTTITVSPRTITNYSVTVTDMMGCEVVVSQVVSVAAENEADAGRATYGELSQTANLADSGAGVAGTSGLMSDENAGTAATGGDVPELRTRAARPDQAPTTVNRLTLEQNTPNPFAGTTRIGFLLPESGAVKLVVTDMAGRQLRVIDREGTAGYNAITLDAGSLRGGTYLYTLYHNGQRETKRMVVR